MDSIHAFDEEGSELDQFDDGVITSIDKHECIDERVKKQ